MQSVTENISLPLLQEYQTKKEHSINKSLLFIDGILNKAIESKVDIFNPNQENDSSFILEESTNLLHINIDNTWHKFSSKKGMIFFFMKEEKWLYFDGSKWKKAC